MGRANDCHLFVILLFGVFDIQMDLLPRGENYQSADLKIIGILRRVSIVNLLSLSVFKSDDIAQFQC